MNWWYTRHSTSQLVIPGLFGKKLRLFDPNYGEFETPKDSGAALLHSLLRDNTNPRYENCAEYALLVVTPR